MHIVIPVTEDGQVDHRWGRAARVAVAAVEDGAVTSWTEHAVGWDVAHDEGTEGSHHARIVRFLREHQITHVMADHMGQGMVHTISRMGLPIARPTSPDAREAVAAYASGHPAE
ncbi:MAG: hypothetical protein LWW86_04960 [Micrococcales bacterium]|nr:hypothetical protein [Micrococcales bacterium]